MTLEAFGKKAAAVSAILVALTLVLGLVGRLSWELWLESRVQDVVRSEMADVRLSIADLAGAIGAPDSVMWKIRLRRELGPAPPP